MHLFVAANVNLMDVAVQILSYSETFADRLGGKSRKNSGTAAKLLKNKQLYHARNAPKWE
jgi:hypothetical protein